jgi:hypothetical protein
MMSHQYPGLLKKANLMGYGRGGASPRADRPARQIQMVINFQVRALV